MAKRLSVEEVGTRFITALDEIAEQIKALKKLRRSFHRLSEEQRDFIELDLINFLGDIEVLADNFGCINKELDNATEQENATTTKDSGKLAGSLPTGDVFGGIFRTIAESISEGLPVVMEKRRKERLEAEGRYDWPDAIDLEKESEPQKLLKE